MENSVIEVENLAGTGVVVTKFQTADTAIGTLQIAGGARQRFENFDRLTLVAPDGAPKVRLVNHSPHPVDLYRETTKGHRFDCSVDDNEFLDTDIAGGEQVYILPRPEPFEIPDQPHLYGARVFSTPPNMPDMQQFPYYIQLEWSHPQHGSGALKGYNIYRAEFDGSVPINHERLNISPHWDYRARIGIFPVHGNRNIRLAVTALNQAGPESLFSNVRIYDQRTGLDLYNAGFIPL